MYFVPVVMEVKMGKGRREEWSLLCLLYARDLVLCGESKEDLKATVGRFIEVCSSSLKVNEGKNKVGGGLRRRDEIGACLRV